MRGKWKYPACAAGIKAALWLAERTRKSARPQRHLTLTLRFPNCWQQQHGSQTPTSECHSNHVARLFVPRPPGGGERRGERFGSGRGHRRLHGGRLCLPRLARAPAERTALRQTLPRCCHPPLYYSVRINLAEDMRHCDWFKKNNPCLLMG